MNSKKKNNFFPHVLYLLIDVLAFNVAVFISYIIPFYVNKGRFLEEKDMAAYEDMTTFLVLIPMLMFVVSGIHKITWFRTTVEDFHQIFRSLFFADVFLCFAIYKLRYVKAGGFNTTMDDWPASTFLIILPLSCILLCAWRFVFRFCVEKEWFSPSKTHRLILVGLNAISDEVIQKIAMNKNPQYNIVATFDEIGQRLSGVSGYNGLHHFEKTLQNEEVDEILLASAGIQKDDLFYVVQYCESHGVDYHILPSYIDLLASKSRVDLINFVPMISYAKSKIIGWNLLFKTLLDLVISVVVLIVLSPIWLLICLLIIVDSKGSPIFTQNRVGRGGCTFKIYKFRTMVKEAEKMGALTENEDKRITRVGHFLRRWSLDEVPQFLNVLLGQMSIIGPRAVVPFVAENFDDWEKISLNVLPGITGLAQVYGRNKLSFYEKSFLSVYYIRNYSLFLDFKIVFRTVGTIFTGVGSGGTIEANRITVDLIDETEQQLFSE